MNFLAFPWDEMPFAIIAIVLAFTLHEFAHAYFADKFGDPTPRAMGRVTLHPIAHIDLLGLILILLAGFGWAKPVLVNRSYFKKPRLMNIIVSLVGPLSNLFLAFISLLIWVLLTKLNMLDGLSSGALDAISLTMKYMIQLNLVLFIFNLIPIPPLDGYRIGIELLPGRFQAQIINREHWGVVIFLALVFIGPLRAITLDPLFSLSGDIFVGMYRFINLFL